MFIEMIKDKQKSSGGVALFHATPPELNKYIPNHFLYKHAVSPELTRKHIQDSGVLCIK